MTWIWRDPTNGAEPAHVCRPPKRWPLLSRRRHPSGSVWECDQFVGLEQARGATNICQRRWILTWFRDAHHTGGLVPDWEEVEPGWPDTSSLLPLPPPPVGRGGASE